MKQIKFQTASEVKDLCAAIDGLAADQKLANEVAKRIKARKEVIKREIADKRGIDIDSLAESEMLLVSIGTERGLKIDRKGSDRIDVAGLRACAPDVADKFTKRTVATYFEPLT